MLTHNTYLTRAHANPGILTRQDPVVYESNQPFEQAALTPAQRDAYRDNGFLFLPELFSQEEVQGLYTEMQHMRKEYARAGRDEVIAEPGSGEVR